MVVHAHMYPLALQTKLLGVTTREGMVWRGRRANDCYVFWCKHAKTRESK